MKMYLTLKTALLIVIGAIAVLVIMPFTGIKGINDVALALTEADCRTCHTGGADGNMVDEHHLLVQTKGMQCLNCHSVKWNPNTKSYYVEIIRDCVVCHGSLAHEAAHDKAIIPYQDCANCHSANVVTEHANRKLDCAVCHSSTDTIIQNAITMGKGGQIVYCAYCHYVFRNHTKQHDQTFLDAGICTTYATNVISEHESRNIYCFTCHTSTNTLVVTAINNGMAGNPILCNSCHTTITCKGQNQPPVANAGPDQTVQVGQSVNFSGSGSYDPDGSIVQYSWNFGDGSTGTGVTTSHTYTTSGTYTVTLTVTDNMGATGTDTAIITVQSAPVTTSVYADQVVWIQNLRNATSSDSSGSTTDITSRFKDNILTDTFTIYNKSNKSGWSGSYKVIAMKLNKDANSYSQVMISLYVKSLYNNSSQNVRIYPYNSNGNSINTSYSSSYTINTTGWSQIDLTSLASRMKGFGWMKFRITCTTTSFDVSEGNFIVK
jgi:PKD repeat protein